jgi:hypothetical protein
VGRYGTGFIYIGILISMALIVLWVRHLEKQISFSPPTSQDGSSTTASGDFRKIKETAEQALCYLLAYFFVFIPVQVTFMFPKFPESTPGNRRLYFAFAFVSKLVLPMSGVFNCFIFLRKRYKFLVRDGECLGFVSHFFSSLDSSVNEVNGQTSTAVVIDASVCLAESPQPNDEIVSGECEQTGAVEPEDLVDNHNDESDTARG